MTNRDKQLTEDVAAASAAYLCDVWPSIIALPAHDAFEYLRQHILTAFIAFFDGQEGWGEA